MSISLEIAVLGFNRHLRARRLSDHTIRDYNTTLRRLVQRLGGETPIGGITTDDIEGFLAHWRDAVIRPAGIADRGEQQLSAKSLENMRVGLSALWTWAVDKGYAPEHIIRGRIKRIKYTPPPIQPFTDEELLAMLAACEKTATSTTRLGRSTSRHRPTAKRDRALLLFLLDTGCRISETINLTMDQLHLDDNKVIVHGKGDKMRECYFSDITGEALFHYLADRGVLGARSRNGKRGVQDHAGATCVFATRKDRPMARSSALWLIYRLADRAGVSGAHPHRFRHTFAIQYLRNGGDVYTLQRQLGHSSLETVRRYLQIAETDIKRVHRRVSPVANLL